MLLSVIVPIYNCRKYIERLLNSIKNQGWNYSDYEVILCDDNSTDNFMELVEPFINNGMDIKYFKTVPRDIHCPGNTRMDGWHLATGDWITFIDNDDMFEDGGFDLFLETMQTSKQDKMIFCKFRDYYEEEDRYGQVFDGTTWLHGKFYNRSWLLSTGIDFKENLFSHEDLFFNSLCVGVLNGNDEIFTMPEEERYAYKWVYRPDSLSRAFFNEKHFYIEVYFKDYIYAASEPWFMCYKAFPQKKDFYLSQIMTVLLYGYFYEQGALWRLGDKEVLDNSVYMSDLLNRTMSVFGLTRTQIIQSLMSSPETYDRIKNECYNGCGKFIESISFKDYIYRL